MCGCVNFILALNQASISHKTTTTVWISHVCVYGSISQNVIVYYLLYCLCKE